MTEDTIRAIEAILSRGERVELMTGPGGEVKILRVRRETIPVKENAKAVPGRNGLTNE